MASSYIIAACRTPIGKFLGSLAAVPAPELGAAVVREALRRSGLEPTGIDEVILGNVLAAGVGQAPARQAALGGGLPATVAATTVNKVCGSGMEAIMLADRAIRCGDARAIVAGGMESMSRAPFVLAGAREGWKFGDQQVIDTMLRDGLWCAFENVPMGAHAEQTAESYQVSRADQDEFAAESHRRAVAAQNEGAYRREIVPITIPDRKAPRVVDRDEGPRSDTSLDALSELKASFQTDGCVTAGNASQISDGAAAVVVVNESTAARHSGEIKARILVTATSGVAPKELFIAPVSAVQQALDKSGMRLDQVELFELNEAFAAQALACMRQLKLSAEKTNVYGGAIALGHPIGASGARIVVTLLHAMAARSLRYGLASACLGGGNAVAMIVERVT